MPLGMEVGYGPGQIVLDGDPTPSPKNGHSPHVLAYIYCGQTAGWMKMPRGKKVASAPGNIVFDADPTPPPRDRVPNFWSLSVVAKRLDGSICHLVRR